MTATISNLMLENEIVLDIINYHLAETRIAYHFIQTISARISENQEDEETIASSKSNHSTIELMCTFGSNIR